MRSLALADALVQRGWRCTIASNQETLEFVRKFASHQLPLLSLSAATDEQVRELMRFLPTGCDLLVIDDGSLDFEFEQACRPWAKRLLAFDDEANKIHDCDFIIDQNAGHTPAHYSGRTPCGCKVLAGGEYALLRPQFPAARQTAKINKAKTFRPDKIVVSFGLTDPMNLSSTALRGISAAGVSRHVDVLLGSAAPFIDTVRILCETLPVEARLHVDKSDVAELFTTVDLAIGAPGSSAWERCCLALPSILVVLADNQRSNADGLANAGAAICLGHAKTLTDDMVANILRELATNPGRLGDMAKAAAGLCDGLGTARVVDTIEAVCRRPATTGP